MTKKKGVTPGAYMIKRARNKNTITGAKGANRVIMRTVSQEPRIRNIHSASIKPAQAKHRHIRPRHQQLPIIS